MPITEPSLFPSDMLGLHNHIQIFNLYTMSPANRNGDEGNSKLHCPTYAVLRAATKYAFDHIVGLIQSYLTEMNMFVKERRCQASTQGLVWPSLKRLPTGARYLSGRLLTRTWSIMWRTYRQVAGWIPNSVTTGFPPSCSGRTKCGCPR